VTSIFNRALPQVYLRDTFPRERCIGPVTSFSSALVNNYHVTTQFQDHHLMPSMNKRLCEHKMIVFIECTDHSVIA